MLYALSENVVNVKVVDSNTLRCFTLSWKDVYNIVRSGKKISNLFCYTRKNDNTDKMIQISTVIGKFSGLRHGSYGRTYQDDLRDCTDLSVLFMYPYKIRINFSTETNDTLVKLQDDYYYVWYKDKYYKFAKGTVRGFYYEDNMLIAVIAEVCGLAVRTLYARLIDLEPIGSITLSQFKRILMLE